MIQNWLWSAIAICAVLTCTVSNTVAQVPDPNTASANAQDAGIYGAREDEPRVLDALLGLRLLPIVGGDVPETPIAESAGSAAGLIDLTGVNVPGKPELTALLAPFIGEPVSIQSIARMQAVLRGHMRNMGYPYYIVSVPNQDVTDGVIALVTQFSLLEIPITVEGAVYFDADALRLGVRQADDGPIYQIDLDEDIARLSRNPYRDIVAVTQRGSAFGTTRLTLSVTDERPYTFSFGLDNTGNKNTGLTRYNMGFQYGDFLGRGDLIRYRYAADPQSRYSRSHTVSSTHFLSSVDDLEFSLNYSENQSNLPSPFDQGGTSSSFAATYNHVASSGLRFALGIDIKETDSTLAFSNTPIFETDTQIVQLRARISRNTNWFGGQGSVGALVVFSPGDASATNSDASFDALRSGASADYAYLRVNMDHRQPLTESLAYSIGLTAQVASDTLLPSEQLAGGGASAVRGFEGGAGFGDNGYVLRNTLSLPSSATFQPSLFIDYAQLTDKEPLSSAPSQTLLGSAGVAMTVSFSESVSLDASIGYLFQGADQNLIKGDVGANILLAARF